MNSQQMIYLVPHTHYDVAWAFTREEYLQINIHILKEALRIIEQNEDFKFCIEQTYLLEELEKREPELWEKVREKIAEGRIVIVDGEYLMPDMMLPCGEVLVREIFVGKKYCKEKFGIDVPVAWAADSFGMNAQLPQIYRKSGYKWVAFRRGARRDINQSEFIWRGLDGTIILAHWMPLGYRAGLNLDRLEESFTYLEMFAATPHILMPCGSGSMPPQEEIPQAVKKWNEEHTTVKMKIATPDEFFEAVERSSKKLQIIEGELYDDELVDVFPQVCSSRTWITQEFRECEKLIYNAELFTTIAWLLGARYPKEELEDAWRKLLYVGFHDLITGCGVDEIYGEVGEIFLSLQKKLPQLIEDSLRFIASKIKTPKNSLVVFNPLNHEVRTWIEAEIELPEGWEGGVQISDGGPLETEILEEERDEEGRLKKVKIGFVGKVPPLGYKAFRIIPGRAFRAQEIDEAEFENQFFKIKILRDSGIIEVYDHKGDKLLKGNELIIEDESGDLYYHQCRFAEIIKSESGEGFEYGSFKPKSFKVLSTPLRTKVIFENEYYCLTWPYRLKKKFPPVLYKYKGLDIQKEIVIYRDLPRIDFTTSIYNQYPCIRLRVRFETGIFHKLYFRESQFGVISEPTEYFAKRERPRPAAIPHFLTWFDYWNGVRGVAFLNRGLPASEIMDDKVLLTLLRGVMALSADGIAGPLVPTPEALELGSYVFKYAVIPHDGDWHEAQIHLRAREYLNPPISLQVPENPEGELPSQFSFFEISPENVLVSAIKRAEEDEAVILRVYETTGEPTRVEIKSLRPFRTIRRAWIADLLEREEREIEVSDGTISLDIRPFEILTLKLLM